MTNKEQLQELVNKIQLMDFAIVGLNNTHIDFKTEAEDIYKKATNHKLKLVDELLRLSNVKDIEIVKTLDVPKV